jgi:hypothetical protein
MRSFKLALCVLTALATLGLDLGASLDLGQPTLSSAQARRRHHRRHHRKHRGRKHRARHASAKRSPEF